MCMSHGGWQWTQPEPTEGSCSSRYPETGGQPAVASAEHLQQVLWYAEEVRQDVRACLEAQPGALGLQNRASNAWRS